VHFPVDTRDGAQRRAGEALQTQPTSKKKSEINLKISSKPLQNVTT